MYVRRMTMVAVAFAAAALPVAAATDTQLRPVKGSVTYAVGTGAAETATKATVLPADATVTTAAGATALVTLADTTEIAIGSGTQVQIGALATGDAPTVVTLQSGFVRFNVRHPAQTKSNYQIKTKNASVAVHGTIGLISSGPEGDEVVCLACDENDVTVTAGDKSYPIKTSQRVKVAAAVLPVVESVGPAVLQPFAIAGLSTSASSAVGVAGVATTAAAHLAGGALVAGAVGVGAVIGVSAAASSTASVPNANTNLSGNLGISTFPHPTPSPSPSPSPAARPAAGSAAAATGVHKP